jgi:hypothetical protein
LPIDPKTIAPGKRYVTATRHIRTVLAVTDDRVRFAYGGSESGGVPQWRWMAKDKFADDAVKEVSESSTSDQPESIEASTSTNPKPSGTRKTLTRRP